MTRNARCHRRGDPKGLMNAPGIVPGEVKRWAATWFSIFFEKALVNRVKRRMDMRIVRFCRSIKLVLM